MLNRVNNNATSGVPGQGAYQPSKSGNVGSGRAHVNSLSSEAEPAAILDVSEEGRNRALQSLEVRYLTPDDPFYSFLTAEMEKMSQMKTDRINNPETAPMNVGNDRMAYTYALEWTLDGLVQSVVNAKMDPKTADAFTTELSHLIYGFDRATGYKIGDTIEERAVNREKGLELAKYIAETYIDAPEDRAKFLDGVNGFYNNAVLIDKGYYVTDGPNGAIVEKPTSTGSDIAGFDKAFKEAAASLSKTVFPDNKTASLAALDKAAEIFLRDAPPGKYDSIVAKFADGKINGIVFFGEVSRMQFAEAYNNRKPISDTSSTSTPEKPFAETEREVSNTIDRVKNTLDITAIREEVQRTIKNILSTFMSYADYEKLFQS